MVTREFRTDRCATYSEAEGTSLAVTRELAAADTPQGHQPKRQDVTTMAKLLDLPTEIRLLIFSYYFDTQFFIVTTPHVDANLRPPRYWWRPCACRRTIRPLHNTGALNVEPYCDCLDPTKGFDVNEGHPDATRMSLLSLNKQLHREAKGFLQDRVRVFNNPADLDSIFLKGPSGRPKAEHLTTLVASVCPASFETHIWNLALKQLYLPRPVYPMDPPEPHLPALQTVQIRLQGEGSLALRAENDFDWKSAIWIFPFRFLALEKPRSVSVESTGYAFVGPVDGEGRATSLELDKAQQEEYAAEVREFLLMDWEPDEEDGIEIMGFSYTHLIRKHGILGDPDASQLNDLGFTEEGDEVKPWG